jgi:hypothetical protein
MTQAEINQVQQTLMRLPAFGTLYGKYTVTLAPMTLDAIKAACKSRLPVENIDDVLQAADVCTGILTKVMQENNNTTKSAVQESINTKVQAFASNFYRRYVTMTYNPNGKYGYGAVTARADLSISPESNTHIDTIQRKQPDYTQRFESLL